METLEHKLADRLDVVKNGIDGKLSVLEKEAFGHLENKLDRNDLDNIMRGKVDDSNVQDAISHLVTKSDFMELKLNLTQVGSEADVSRSEYAALSKKVEETRKELTFKANIKDICSLIDMKANIEDVNQIFVEMNTELDFKQS
jgi:hypothetical protein